MSKMQFKKVIQYAEWEKTICTMQVRIHTPQIAIHIFTKNIMRGVFSPLKLLVQNT
jgi:hypothetical protein